VQGGVTVHPCEILLIRPAEACHASILNRSTAVIALIALIYPAPDILLCLIGEVSGTVVAGLIAPIAPTDVVALPLTIGAEVWQNNRVDVAARTPPVSSRLSVTWVIALRKALMTIVTPKNGCTCVATVGASH
jgi:hypothetical protein